MKYRLDTICPWNVTNGKSFEYFIFYEKVLTGKKKQLQCRNQYIASLRD